MSDLQCPATLLIAATELGSSRVHDLVEQVRGRRVAAVYGSSGEAAESARLAASELGLEPRFSEALGESADPGDPGDPAAGSRLVIERFTRAIDEIADVHRGEAVLVFTCDRVMGLAIPGATRHPVPDGGVVPVTEMEVDGDGWRLRSV